MSDAGYRPSSLEHSLGFSDPAFGEYMQFSMPQGGPSKLVELASAMASHDHPVVRCAAGWAFAEAAMHRQRQNTSEAPLPLTSRLGYLSTVTSLWPQAIDGLKTTRLHAPSRFKGPLWRTEVETQYARVHMPVMRLVARWFSGVETDTNTQERVVQGARANVLALITGLGKRTLRSEFVQIRSDLSREALTSLLVDNNRYVTVPASPRQRYGKAEVERVNLMAVSVRPTYARTAIRIKPASTAEERETRMRAGVHVITACRDLVTGPGQSSDDTLDLLLAREQGEVQDPAVVEQLDRLSKTLTARIGTFRKRIIRGTGSS